MFDFIFDWRPYRMGRARAFRCRFRESAEEWPGEGRIRAPGFRPMQIG